MKYTVRRAHQGDKWYAEGDTREARAADVAHLVQNDVLANDPDDATEQKALEGARRNKAVASSAKNKAE